jgi:hypothetical protein
MTVPETPNLDKAHEVHKQSQAIGDFLEWVRLASDTHERLLFAFYRGDVLIPASYNIQQLLAEFFGIDYDAMERERWALLEYMRAVNTPRADKENISA